MNKLNNFRYFLSYVKEKTRLILICLNPNYLHSAKRRKSSSVHLNNYFFFTLKSNVDNLSENEYFEGIEFT